MQGEDQNAYMLMVGKSEIKRPLEKDENVKTDHEELGWEGVNWIHLAQELQVMMGLCGQCYEPSCCITFREISK
jgi:uncharacterized protein CbrC (UPF0167 family)